MWAFLLTVLLSLLVDASLADAFHMSSSPLRSSSPSRRNFKSIDDSATTIMPGTSAASSALSQSAEVADTTRTQIRGGSVGVPSLETTLSMLPDQILQGRSAVHKFCVSAAKSTFSVFKKCWWALPMALAIVPVYSALVWNVLPTMPHWWPLTRMDQLFTSPSWNVIVTVFLSSNLFYFVSGAYLWGRFSWESKSHADGSTGLKGFPMLGGLIMTAGAVSTTFHYFQALGSFRIAEALCYVDHAVAISSILYFWHRCGRPGLAASLMAAAGFATLAITQPLVIYPYLHSAWHGLSAGAAVFWANDGVNRRMQMMEQQQSVVVGPATL
jgi:hypothetical protein